MDLHTFRQKIKTEPENIDFPETMEVIDKNYYFTPTEFENGGLKNEAGENSGSCKLFYFAREQGFSEQQTLHCFGEYYREDVLKNPQADNHQNIRNFMKTGWLGIHFKGEVLQEKDD